MRELVYYIAVSMDGFISAQDGGLDDFNIEGEHLQEIFDEFPETLPEHLSALLKIKGEAKHFDTVLMGRSTYDVGRNLGFLNPYPHLKQYLFSKTEPESPHPDIQLVSENALEVVKELKQEEGLDIWLCGGGQLASALFPEIDRLILKVNPFILGEGRPLFTGGRFKANLQPVSLQTYANGFQLAEYSLES